MYERSCIAHTTLRIFGIKTRHTRNPNKAPIEVHSSSYVPRSATLLGLECALPKGWSYFEAEPRWAGR